MCRDSLPGVVERVRGVGAGGVGETRSVRIIAVAGVAGAAAGGHESFVVRMAYRTVRISLMTVIACAHAAVIGRGSVTDLTYTIIGLHGIDKFPGIRIRIINESQRGGILNFHADIVCVRLRCNVRIMTLSAVDGSCAVFVKPDIGFGRC